MANLDRIVDVNISLKPAGIQQEGFDTILIMAPHCHGVNRVDIYTNVDDMLTAGFDQYNPLYLAAVDAFSQEPKPTKIKIGRQQVDTSKITINTVADNSAYSCVIKYKDSNSNIISKSYQYTSTTGSTATSIASGLQALITADVANIPVTASASAGVITLANKVSGTAYQIIVSTNIKVTEYLTTETPTASLTAIVAEDDAWYGLLTPDRTQSKILETAQWVEAHTKLYFACTGEAGAIDAASVTDTAYKLKQNNYFRTAIWYHSDAADFPDVAAMVRGFSIQPGGETFANMQLYGVTYDKLSETQAQALFAKNGNSFEQFRNISITQNGKTAGGEWIDVIRFRDWLEEEIKIETFRIMVNSKIPYTDAGIQKVGNALIAALERGKRNGGIAPDEYDGNQKLVPGYIVTLPLSSSISANDKANRVFKPQKIFSARLAGAIHVVQINGTLGVTL